MSQQTTTTQEWRLVSVALADAYTDFMLSRQAMQCSPTTLSFYRYTAGTFVKWLETQGVTRPDDLNARLVRQYLAEMVSRQKAEGTVRDHARAIRTLVLFWHAEKYLHEPVNFAIPKVAKRRQATLTAEQLSRVISACKNPRDRAIVLFLADSGLRRAEVCNLNWSDVDFGTGQVRVVRGKGGKPRSTAIGAATRRALLAYRRTLESAAPDAPLFQARGISRFTGSGMLQVFRRLTKKTGIHVTVHAMRRTFAILSLRAGMGELYVQGLLGHAGLEMVRLYAQMVDDDLMQEHRIHSPIDNLGRLK